jgi:hypothetical protein
MIYRIYNFRSILKGNTKKGALRQTNKEKAEKIESLNKHEHEEELNKMQS